MTKVFVYGTLRKLGANPCSNYGGTFVQSDTIGGTLFDLGPFPGWSSDENRCTVHGDLYEVDEEILALLDRYESEGTLYSRVRVVTNGGHEAFTYEIAKWVTHMFELKVVDSGDWLNYYAEKQREFERDEVGDH